MLYRVRWVPVYLFMLQSPFTSGPMRTCPFAVHLPDELKKPSFQESIDQKLVKLQTEFLINILSDSSKSQAILNLNSPKVCRATFKAKNKININIVFIGLRE